jgi:acetolactate synthase-1/2/3 large subunit
MVYSRLTVLEAAVRPFDPPTQTTGGGLLADTLAACGVRTVFALGGAGHTHFLLPLEDRGFRIIGTRHESGAVGAADGYARATGGIGVAAIIAEQGLANATTAIQCAYMYGSPVVVLVTRWIDAWVEPAGEIPVDLHATLQPITKWARTVPSVAKLGEYMRTALRIAQSGRPGPVVLTIPQDMMMAAVASPAVLPMAAPPLPAGASEDAIARTLALLKQAKAPAILVDSGCRGDAAGPALAVLRDAGLAVFGYGGARGLIPEDDVAGVLPWPYAQVALGECDVLVAAGVQLNMWFGFGRAPRFPEALQVVQIDAEGEAIGRNRAVALGVVADPATALGQLACAVQEEGLSWSRDWLDTSLGARRERVAAVTSGAAIHALDLARSIELHRPGGGMVAGDGADVLNWSYGAIRIDTPRGYMDHHPMGSMGTGLPLAIGAAAAELDRADRDGGEPIAVTLLTGDGAFGFFLAELETIARHRLPLRIVVGNDAQWGTEYHGQKVLTGRFVNTRLSPARYDVVAQGLGVPGTALADPDRLDDVVARFFASPAPGLLDVTIDPEAGLALKADPLVSFLVFRDLAPPEA